MPKQRQNKKAKTVKSQTHKSHARPYIPTAEFQAIMEKSDLESIQATFKRRNPDLDPQLVWRGKIEQSLSRIVVSAPPIYIQEKVLSEALVRSLLAASKGGGVDTSISQDDLFADFNGLPDIGAKTEFYEHDANWTNRMILGDSLQVMASLIEREKLRGSVQCIFIDPPYGIKFASNFQYSTNNTNVSDGKVADITREPEQVKAFRDTWEDGIHSYLSYLRDRITVARELLTDSGSLFLQIGDENAHLIRLVIEEIFGSDNYIREIFFKKTGHLTSKFIGRSGDRLIWFAKDKEQCKSRPLFEKKIIDDFYTHYEDDNLDIHSLKKNVLLPKSFNVGRAFQFVSLDSPGAHSTETPFNFQGRTFHPSDNRHWSVTWPIGMERLSKSGRISVSSNRLRYRLFIDDYPVKAIGDVWSDTSGYVSKKKYVVETRPGVIQRCILLSTDPGDLVLDPTCGSGTTAYVSEQFGRRWITIDTSRVALALSRARIMNASYPYYYLADSKKGLEKEAELSRTFPLEKPTYGNIKHGFVYEREQHTTLKSISENAEIDVIWEKYQDRMQTLLQNINMKLKKQWKEYEVPRDTDKDWPIETQKVHAQWNQERINRQKEMEVSIAAKSDQEYQYHLPLIDKSIVRVSGPFTVESLSPHRMLDVGEDDQIIDNVSRSRQSTGKQQDFATMIMDHLLSAGVQQPHKEDKISFDSLTPWTGRLISAEGLFVKEKNNLQDETSKSVKRAGVMIGPEFGTVSRADLTAAAREAGEAGFDVLVTCAFNYDALSSDFKSLGRIPVLKARMNADLHMADLLKNTGKGNLFVIFGEPDITIHRHDSDNIQVEIKGVDVYHPRSGEIRSHDAEGIACWLIDTNYNEESFFVRHAYFPGNKNLYSELRRTLKAEINEETWTTLRNKISRPFPNPISGRFAVKVINHLGDEVMKVFRV